MLKSAPVGRGWDRREGRHATRATRKSLGFSAFAACPQRANSEFGIPIRSGSARGGSGRSDYSAAAGGGDALRRIKIQVPRVCGEVARAALRRVEFLPSRRPARRPTHGAGEFA
jgi:hypothetical protein